MEEGACVGTVELKDVHFHFDEVKLEAYSVQVALGSYFW